MAHAFTSLLLVDLDFVCKLTQDLDPHLHPVGQSNLSRSIIPTEKELLEKSVIERLTKVKGLVISCDFWMSRKTEEIFSLMAHYCKGPKRNNTHIGMLSSIATNGVSLFSSVMEVVENFGLEKNIVGSMSDGGGNPWFYKEALESKYTNDFFSLTQIPIQYRVPCTYVGRGLQGGGVINQVGCW